MRSPQGLTRSPGGPVGECKLQANGLLVTFSVNGHQVALLTATGVGVSVLLGAGGGLTWTQDT
jgi:hypothetical protein